MIEDLASGDKQAFATGEELLRWVGLWMTSNKMQEIPAAGNDA